MKRDLGHYCTKMLKKKRENLCQNPTIMAIHAIMLTLVSSELLDLLRFAGQARKHVLYLLALAVNRS